MPNSSPRRSTRPAALERSVGRRSAAAVDGDHAERREDVLRLPVVHVLGLAHEGDAPRQRGGQDEVVEDREVVGGQDGAARRRAGARAPRPRCATGTRTGGRAPCGRRRRADPPRVPSLSPRLVARRHMSAGTAEAPAASGCESASPALGLPISSPSGSADRHPTGRRSDGRLALEEHAEERGCGGRPARPARRRRRWRPRRRGCRGRRRGGPGPRRGPTRSAPPTATRRASGRGGRPPAASASSSHSHESR